MKSQRIPIDDKNYTVVGINGFRQGNLTREQAESLARKMQEQMVMAGWAGKMRIYYRDGSEWNWNTGELV